MSLTVETGAGVTGADCYGSLANGLTYLADMGYVGTFAVLPAPKVNGAVAADATTLDMDGGSGSETLLGGEKFGVTGVAGTYTVSGAYYAQSGAISSVTFSPVAPSGGFGNDAALLFRVLTDAQVRRGARTLDALYEPMLKGVRVLVTQAMAWPREGMTDRDGYSIANNAVPTPWVQAGYELARICPADQSLDFPTWLSRVKAGSVEVEGGLQVRTVLSYVEELIGGYIDSNAYRVKRAV